MKEKIVVGLGNPGRKYEDTRHNVGFWLVDTIAHKYKFPLFEKEKYLFSALGKVASVPVLLIKPLTYMNRSGRALAYLEGKKSYLAEDVLVCYDDLDLPIGSFRLRARGSSGGHKGVQSIINFWGHNEFSRLRVGVAPEKKPIDSAEYVLSNFAREEEIIVLDLMPRIIDAVECYLVDGIEKAMNKFNRA